ncbi:LexA family transcriptional regulator [Fibrella forsythiae]|uniref:Helix-turn-helix domain-containing protein n=1 Tax=Fibrella forsythiae TaxID=2817061 RepID=A0ABS3JD34_9BACT|nr:LexA family transcriptional regulator [Fibrella forsythiae]MBO0947356.1 helix-turn-helix domain-containing protein [Fibrella forsythiae]
MNKDLALQDRQAADRLLKIFESNNWDQAEVALKLGYERTIVNKYINGKQKISDKFLYKLQEVYNISKEFIKTGAGPLVVTPPAVPNTPQPPMDNRTYKIEAIPIELNPDGDVTKNWRGSEFVDLPNGMVMMSVPLVDQFAYAGYLSGWKDPEFLHELPKYSFVTHKRHGGKYMAFEVRGDSMDDNTRDAICEGDEVLGREVERHFWKSKFHLHRFEDYIIVHQDGIITKRIVAHDVENGIITCVSINPNKDLYPDQEIKLAEVFELYNILRVSHNRRRR